jgi:ubiquilin
MSREITITVKCSNTDKDTFVVDIGLTIGEFKDVIAEKMGVPVCAQRLIFKGRVLKDELTLEHYEVCDGQTVHLVKSSPPKTESTPPSAAAAAAPVGAPAPTASAAPGGIPDINSLMSQFGGMGGGGGGGMGGGMSGMQGADMNAMSQQMMQNPEMMQQMMNSPMMQNLLNNPETMSSLLNSNPQIQAMLDANPQMRHALNDPAVIQPFTELQKSNIN